MNVCRRHKIDKSLPTQDDCTTDYLSSNGQSDDAHDDKSKTLLESNPFPEANQHGLSFEYIYHTILPGPEMGPQKIDLVLHDADVHWEYLLDLSISDRVSKIFCTFFYPDWCSPNPLRELDQWVYFNITMTSLSVTVSFPTLKVDTKSTGIAI